MDWSKIKKELVLHLVDMVKLVVWAVVVTAILLAFVHTVIYSLSLHENATKLYGFLEGRLRALGIKLYSTCEDAVRRFPRYLASLQNAVPVRQTAHDAFRGSTSGVLGAFCGEQVAQEGLFSCFQPLAINPYAPPRQNDTPLRSPAPLLPLTPDSPLRSAATLLHPQPGHHTAAAVHVELQRAMDANPQLYSTPQHSPIHG